MNAWWPKRSASEKVNLPSIARHWSREPYIPIRRHLLVRMLAGDTVLAESERDAFIGLARKVSATFHHEFQSRLENLKEAYFPFDPDDDTQSTETWDDEQRLTFRNRFFQDIEYLLRCAGYRLLAREEIEQAVATASDWGVRLKVDFSLFEHLDVYARGDVIGFRQRRNWRRWFQFETVGLPIYQRLVIIYCLHRNPRTEEDLDANGVHVKLFKNVPKLDVDMLLPGTRVRLSLLDQGRIAFPTLSGAAITLARLLRGALWVALAGTFWGLIGLLGILFAAIGYGVRSVLGYLRTKDKYQLSLARSRYYQQLDSNAGVIYRMLDEAEEQVTRETLLAYFLLWKRAPPEGWTDDEVQSGAESYLFRQAELPVAFQCEEALENALRLGIVRPADSGRYIAVPLPAAIEQVE